MALPGPAQQRMGAVMDNLGTILAVVASLVTIVGGFIGVLQYLEHAPWSKRRGGSGGRPGGVIVAVAVAVALLAVLTGTTLAILQRQQRQQTPVSASSPCARLSTFSQAVAPALGTAFGAVAFPPDALADSGNFFELNGYQFEIVHVCVTSLTDATALRSYYMAQMPAQQWTPSSTFPLGGNANTPCAEVQTGTSGDSSAVCWSQDSRSVLLRSVNVVRGGANTSSAVTYDLWLSVAPVTGTDTIARNSTFAFESSTVDSGDIQWHQQGNGPRIVGPIGSATMAYVGQQDFAGLSASVLRSMPFGTGALSVGPDGGLTTGDVFGVYTTAGHYVKVQVVSAASGLQISWVLYPYLLD